MEFTAKQIAQFLSGQVQGDEKREGRADFRNLDMADYARKTFGMFGGEERTVTIECENRFAGVMIDRFGKDVTFVKRDAEHFAVITKVAVSPQFIGWIVGLGEGVKVTNECHSIAFPLISAGIFGYPVNQAWRKALQACIDFISNNQDYDIHIIFTVIDDNILEIGQQTLTELEADNVRAKKKAIADS